MRLGLVFLLLHLLLADGYEINVVGGRLGTEKHTGQVFLIALHLNSLAVLLR